jgi:hypothetical protein
MMRRERFNFVFNLWILAGHRPRTRFL